MLIPVIKERPCLDGIRFIIIKERGTRIAALQAGRVDVTMPSEGTKPAADRLKRAVLGMVVYETSRNVNDNILMNFKKPPFTDARVRRAVSLAIDRRGYIQAVRQGGAVGGASMLPQSWGNWGLSPDGLATLPGRGDPPQAESGRSSTPRRNGVLARAARSASSSAPGRSRTTSTRPPSQHLQLRVVPGRLARSVDSWAPGPRRGSSERGCSRGRGTLRCLLHGR